tara:strand:- start:485 stop:979 length:495 start_codon:yes stop_codon:yes gene_type:complete
MKNIVFLLSFFFLFACGDDPFSKVKSGNVEMASVRDNSPSKFPAMSFDKTTHDFGVIQNGTPVETVFSYTNTGQAPLVIADIKSTCGCTVPKDWSREPLNPGESSQFTVKFDGKGLNNTSKTVTVTANTQTGRETVKITAFINNPEMAEKLKNRPKKTPGPIIQ